MSTFGERLRNLRKEAGLSMDKLAENVNMRYNSNINKSMLSKWENNKEGASMDSVRILADYFNVSLDYLLSISNSPAVIEQDKEAKELYKFYNLLNVSGKKKVLEYIKDLTEIPTYNNLKDEDIQLSITKKLED